MRIEKMEEAIFAVIMAENGFMKNVSPHIGEEK